MDSKLTGRKLEICREILENLSDYLDKDLSDDACSEVEEYIGGCDKRREFVRSLRNTVELCHKFELEMEPRPLEPDAKKSLRAAYERAMKNCPDRQSA